MSMPPRAAIAWATGAGLGIALAVGLGPFGPGWGAALAFPWLALLFAIGSWIERDGEGMTDLLRLTLALTIAFLAISVPITSGYLEAARELAGPAHAAAVLSHIAHLRAQLLLRWAVVGMGVPAGVALLALRRGRSRSQRSSDAPSA
jgi:hypothetical protein